MLVPASRDVGISHCINSEVDERRAGTNNRNNCIQSNMDEGTMLMCTIGRTASKMR